MKLTKQFWKWLSQVLALGILIVRADLVVVLFKLLPIVDITPLYPLITVFVVIVITWGAWLTWRGYIGFCQRMDFLMDDTRFRW